MPLDGPWRACGLALAALLTGCAAIDEIQTPGADIDLSPEPGAAGAAGAGGQAGSSSDGRDCASLGWALVNVGGRDQLPAWSAPVLTQSCGTAPHRLTALAPRLGSSLSLLLAANTGRVLEATYSTTGIGADGEEWGDYEAWIDLGAAALGAVTTPGQQPFQLAGTILGPFGPVPIELSGCARVRAAGC
jgi:hypothetical protein